LGGFSKEVLSAFPADVKLNLGYSLRRLQNGEFPACDTRAMPSIGKGVWELKESDDRGWYRLIYLSKIGSVIHVLHCFEKGSRKTGQRDVATARTRLTRVLERIQKGKK
jgi:phage-related protein